MQSLLQPGNGSTSSPLSSKMDGPSDPHHHHLHHQHQHPTTNATAPTAKPSLPQQPQHQHQRRRSALEGAGVSSASPLVVGPGGVALLGSSLGGGGSPARPRSTPGSTSGSGIDSPSRLGESSPLSSYALRIMRERAAAMATAAAAAASEEKGESEATAGGSSISSSSSSGGGAGGVGEGARQLSFLSSHASPTKVAGAGTGAVIRSVEEEDEEEEEEGATVKAKAGGCHACPNAAATAAPPNHELPASGSSGSGSSGSSSGPEMCCRNCGSSEVVKVRFFLLLSTPAPLSPMHAFHLYFLVF